MRDQTDEQPVLEVNAFRIVSEVGDSFFLDFIHYSPATRRGVVVVERIRMHRECLEAVRVRLASDVMEVDEPGISVFWPQPDQMVN